MHDNRPRHAVVVEPRLQPLKAERAAVLAAIGLPGLIQADGGLVAVRGVGERCRHISAAVLAMGNPLLEQQFPGAQVEHPQTLVTRGLGVIDHRQQLVRVAVTGAGIGGECQGEGREVGARRQLLQLGGARHGLRMGGMTGAEEKQANTGR
ncbi:hypothetical protein D9M70_599970 [compost metagenome]